MTKSSIMKRWFYLLWLVAAGTGCTCGPETEKHLPGRERIVDVRENVVPIQVRGVLLGEVIRPYLIGERLLILDPLSEDKLIHLFDKNDFRYLGSAVPRGRGPGEIANVGRIGIDEAERVFYLSDHGKQAVFAYDPDSVLADPFYVPKVKTAFEKGRFPGRYQYVTDTLSFALVIEPTGNSGYRQSLARWNLVTGEMTPLKYVHPEIERKRIDFAVSPERKICAEAYAHHDLLTLCTWDGDLICNVYGPQWTPKTSNRETHYGQVAFCGDRIFALYAGKAASSEGRANHPTRFRVFDAAGRYLRTLETGRPVTGFCYDPENRRIVLTLGDADQLAYLDTAGLDKLAEE